MADIIIIDAPCGAGKTSWAIQEMDNCPDTSYVFCTPFLSEAQRIIDSCKKHCFTEPKSWEQSKIDDFNSLLKENKDIAVTHSTFLNATPQTIQLIEEGHYTLIIDEALDVVQDFNDIHGVQIDAAQKIDKSSIQLLRDGGFIRIAEQGKVEWIGGHYDGGKFQVVERLATAGRLYLVNDTVMVCVYPPEVFRAFEAVYVLTYLCEGSPICPYFEMFGIGYKKMGITGNHETGYALCEHTSEGDRAFRALCAEKVHLCDNHAMLDAYTKSALSKKWYDNHIRRCDNDIKKLKSHVTNFYRRIGAKATDLITYSIIDRDGTRIEVQSTGLMWTCYKPYERAVRGKGYTSGKRLTMADGKDVQERITCFVPSNAKASNKYRVRWALAYLINMYYPPYMAAFFNSGGVSFNTDCYAVSCLVQWICRSRIRDGNPIELYLPSERMRKLYRRWIMGKFS